ncbi:hypothetical protein [Escherichia albertii]|uniref:hypothetical protein n=1 Tax=Escherichia albertii TaxID=208962 RepID=UPI000DE43C49|nr:hypothetical protein [Escherichia albertii]EFB7458152.1 hypothetical protein [Escherichia albertii]EFO4720404.1 hypothetical protein [Escherichia albertii]MCZ8600469.1 hypothetical protein [Escherichia albertii]
MSFLINKSKALSLEANSRYFDWYNRRTRERELDKLKGMFDESDEFLSAEEYYERLDFSPFELRDDVLVYIRNAIEARKEEEKRQIGYYGIMPTLRMPVSILSNDVQEEFELIDALKVRILANINDIIYVHDEIVKEKYGKNLITISIVASSLLFILGVIYPLSFIPKAIGEDINITFMAFFDVLFSIKGFFLSLLAIVFLSLMLAFLYINITLRFESEVISELEFYMNISAYSEYFGNEYKNSVHLKEMSVQ